MESYCSDTSFLHMDIGTLVQDCLGRLKGRDNLVDVSIDERIILKWILKKNILGCGVDLCSSE
jgi:hypothetical protein